MSSYPEEEEAEGRMTEEKRRSESAHNVHTHHCAVEEYSKSERESLLLLGFFIGDKAVTIPSIFALCTAWSKLERSATFSIPRFIFGTALAHASLEGM